MKLFLILLVGIAVAAPPPPPFPPAPAYLNFTKSSNVDTVQSAGQTIYYVITAENKGTTNINIQKTSDPFLESSGTPLVCVPDITKAYTLKPAEKAQCTGSYTVTQADINNGNDILNSATIIEQTPKGIQTYSSNLVRVMIAKKALQVRYEGLTITDQGLLDMNPALGIISRQQTGKEIKRVNEETREVLGERDFNDVMLIASSKPALVDPQFLHMQVTLVGQEEDLIRFEVTNNDYTEDPVQFQMSCVGDLYGNFTARSFYSSSNNNFQKDQQISFLTQWNNSGGYADAVTAPVMMNMGAPYSLTMEMEFTNINGGCPVPPQQCVPRATSVECFLFNVLNIAVE